MNQLVYNEVIKSYDLHTKYFNIIASICLVKDSY